MGNHPPSQRRELLRRYKAGEHPVPMLEEAMQMEDPGMSALAILELAGDSRVKGNKAAKHLVEVTKRMRRLEQPTRQGETWSHLLRILAGWRVDEDHQRGKEELRANAVAWLQGMPNGSWLRDAMDGLAPYVGQDFLPALLRRAITNKGFESESSKMVLRHADVDLTEVLAEASPDLAANLSAHLARKGKGSLQDALVQAFEAEDAPEALRQLIWNLSSEEDLAVVARAGKSTDHAALILTTVGAREDRLRVGDPNARFQAAAQAVQAMEGAGKAKATRKLREAMERAHLAFPDWLGEPVAKAEPVAEPPVNTTAGKRNTLALVGTYTGGLGPVHVRAVGRAAALCAAFELDLALIDFPGTLEDVLTVASESNIGEGEGYLETLHKQGSVLWLAKHDPLPGHPVATTPHPASDKMGAWQYPVCLLIGLGRQGLPKRILEGVGRHYELTGKGISLETATAMGILADRLGQFGRTKQTPN